MVQIDATNSSYTRHVVKIRNSEQLIGSIFLRIDLVKRTDNYPVAYKYLQEMFPDRFNSYRSFVDFLFCELNPRRWRAACLKYYEEEDRGVFPRENPLDNLTKEEVEHYDKQLSIAILLARYLSDSKKRCSWFKFRVMVCQQTAQTESEKG